VVAEVLKLLLPFPPGHEKRQNKDSNPRVSRCRLGYAEGRSEHEGYYHRPMAVRISHCSAGREVAVTNSNIKKKPTGLAVGVGGIDYFPGNFYANTVPSFRETAKLPISREISLCFQEGVLPVCLIRDCPRCSSF
jgi:hypothetical protein